MSEQLTLITGGAGFIGSNLAQRLLGAGRKVRVLDNLSRPGVEQNLQWLREQHGERLQVVVADVRDDEGGDAGRGRRARQVFHFAAQVAVTTSLDDPRDDFAVNAQGTLNVLEAARARPVPPFVLITSTNKVYGDLDDLQLQALGQRYRPPTWRSRARGVSEARPLDFHSPYGCSKGTADQYVLDYARSYGLATMVFRMSCIYGPRQFGTEDQGWVAHFILRALRGEPITLYGDGRQVRDILFVDDLVDAFLLAEQHAGALAGRAFNIGGGPANAISLLDLLDRIEALQGRRPAADLRWLAHRRPALLRLRHARLRAGDRLAARRCARREGIARLHEWLQRPPQAGGTAPLRRRACGTEEATRDAGMRDHRRRDRRTLQDARAAASPGRARCCCGWKARACAPPACRCGKVARGSSTRRRRARRATKAGAASRRSAKASPAWRSATASPRSPTARMPSTTSPTPRAVVQLPASLDGHGRARRAAGLRDQHLPAQRDPRRTDRRDRRHRLPRRPAHAAGHACRRARDRDLAPARSRSTSRTRFGARHTVVMDDHRKVLEQVRQLTGGQWCERVIECTGLQWPLDLASELSAERGRLVIAGYHQDGLRQVNMQLWNWRGLDVINAHERDPQAYVDGMRRGGRADGARRARPAAALHAPPAARPARRGARAHAHAAGRIPEGAGASMRHERRHATSDCAVSRCGRTDPLRRRMPRLGFLGVGWIGQHRMQALLDEQACEVVAIADPSPDVQARVRAARAGGRRRRHARRAARPSTSTAS